MILPKVAAQFVGCLKIHFNRFFFLLLKLKNNLTDLSGFIKFEDGKITYHSTTVPKKANLTLNCPGNMVQEIIRNDLFWDEIISG